MNIQHFIPQLYQVLAQSCWQADTSAFPDKWISENPTIGQCDVSALIVQDFWGGSLLWADVNGQSHYWNLISPLPWLEADLTREQFEGLTGPVPNPQMRDRNYVLSFPETVRRYDLLKSRVSQHVHVV